LLNYDSKSFTNDGCLKSGVIEGRNDEAIFSTWDEDCFR